MKICLHAVFVVIMVLKGGFICSTSECGGNKRIANIVCFDRK